MILYILDLENDLTNLINFSIYRKSTYSNVQIFSFQLSDAKYRELLKGESNSIDHGPKYPKNSRGKYLKYQNVQGLT